jgi:hypothetical protein
VSRKFISLILIFLSSQAAFGEWKARRALLRDGFVLTGVDGRLVSRDSNEAPQDPNVDFIARDRWFFEFDSEVTDGRGIVKAGETLELLPSSTLEKMIASLRTYGDVTFSLYRGRVTKYKEKNFIFPTYFLILSRPVKPPSEAKQTPTKPQLQETKPTVTPLPQQQKKGVTVNEPNDVLTIPKEILEKLKAKRVLGPPKAKQAIEDVNDSGRVSEGTQDRKPVRKEGPASKPDSVIIGRTALFHAVRHDVFVLDALGRNVPKSSFRLLPCQTLQMAQEEQSAEPDPIRFKIAGIATVYKGNKYLLLQKATRLYNHKNFPR